MVRRQEDLILSSPKIVNMVRKLGGSFQMSQSFDENTGRDSQLLFYPIDFVSCTGKPGEDLLVVRPSLELFIWIWLSGQGW